jgi:hypothetical protein
MKPTSYFPVCPISLLVSASCLLSASAFAQVAAPTVSNDETNVYYKIPYTGMPSFVQVYLNTDRNDSTGYTGSPSLVGAEYLFENGSLYRYSGTGTGWSWTLVKSVPYSKGTTVATVTIPRSDLGSPTGLVIATYTTSPTIASAKINQTFTASTTPNPTPTLTISPTPTTTSPITTSPTPTIKTPITTSPSPTTTSPSPTSTSATTSVSYSASTADIANPERGFFVQAGCNNPISQSTLMNYRASGITLVRCYFDLGDFVSSPISSNQLNVIQTQMDNLRAAGMKAILLFPYNFTSSNVDAALPQLLSHMDQLAPYLERNKDVIAAVLQGFVGAWGENSDSMHYGSSPNLSTQNWTDRNTIATKMLATTPVERMVLLRTPLLKTRYNGTSPIASNEAYNGSAKSRHGHDNNCFLASSTDFGTYTNVSVDYPYMAADTTYTAVGGETCQLAPPRTDCPTALQELAKFHWSFLHLYYNTNVLNAWRNQGCFTQVQQKLGYRFVLQNGTYSNSAWPGGAFAVNFTIRNDGWASPYNAREVELVFRNTTTGELYRSKLNVDPRRWQSGQTITVNENVVLPADMAKGNYSVMLNLPDPMSSLRNRPEYAIQLANNNVWEANTGFNNLNHTLSVAP